ncbi:hypothetical protein [Bacillus sp. Hm123]|uniref:hypothetical protein n=1 Tax=Bacillus sp. Hm123 TaxID=3450745 RepID=UPI003F43F8DC
MNGRKFKLALYCLIGFFIYSFFVPAPVDYLIRTQEKSSLISIESVFDYTLPLFASLMIFYVFLEDYKGRIYEILAFYNPRKRNKIMLYRWSFFVSLFMIGSFICALFYYRNISFIDLTSILLSIRFLPNILFLSSLLLVTIVLTKNNFVGLFVTLSYCAVDFLSAGRMFKIFSIGAHTNNFYYAHSPQYYFVNRCIILSLSILFMYIATKKSFKVRLSPKMFMK